MSDVEYVVNFGSDKSIQFVKLSMAEVEHHGARLGKPIVRCRDCAKSAEGRMFGGDAVTVCTRFETYNHVTEPNGFCAWGERRVDA